MPDLVTPLKGGFSMWYDKLMDNNSIDNLARMVKEGFDKTATKEDVSAVGDEVSSVREDIGRLETRLDRIEQLILQNHEERLKRIEDALGWPIKKSA